MNIPDWLAIALNDYEWRKEPHNEAQISDAVRAARKTQGDIVDVDAWKCFLAEFSAFRFIERTNEDKYLEYILCSNRHSDAHRRIARVQA